MILYIILVVVNIFIKYSHQQFGSVWKIDDVHHRVHLLGDNDSHKYRLSSCIMGWDSNNLRETHEYDYSEESFRNDCLFFRSDTNYDRICVDRGSWIANQKDELILINMFTSKSENISNQYTNILKREIGFVNAFLIVFNDTQISTNLKNILTRFDGMYGDKFWKHVLILPTSSYDFNCTTQSKKIVENIRSEFFIDKSEDIVCLANFTDGYENRVFKMESDKIWEFIFNRKSINFTNTVNEVDINLMTALRVQSFVENFIFNDTNSISI